MARVYEAVVLLLLLGLLVLGIVWVASALLHDNIARKSLYGESPAFIHENPSVTTGFTVFNVSYALNFRPVGVLPSLPLLGHLFVWSVAVFVYVYLSHNYLLVAACSI